MLRTRKKKWNLKVVGAVHFSRYRKEMSKGQSQELLCSFLPFSPLRCLQRSHCAISICQFLNSIPVQSHSLGIQTFEQQSLDLTQHPTFSLIRESRNMCLPVHLPFTRRRRLWKLLRRSFEKTKQWWFSMFSQVWDLLLKLRFAETSWKWMET